jgi:hypothetical protein
VTAVSGIIALADLRRLVGVGWIAFIGRVVLRGATALRDVVPTGVTLEIANVEEFIDVRDRFRNPAWNLICSESVSGGYRIVHDAAMHEVDEVDGSPHVIDVVTPFFLDLLLTKKGNSYTGGYPAHGIVQNKLDITMVTQAIHDLNEAGMLAKFFAPDL